MTPLTGFNPERAPQAIPTPASSSAPQQFATFQSRTGPTSHSDRCARSIAWEAKKSNSLRGSLFSGVFWLVKGISLRVKFTSARLWRNARVPAQTVCHCDPRTMVALRRQTEAFLLVGDH